MKTEILESASELGISVPNDFANASEELLAVVCNGCGAEWMPSVVRDALDARFDEFEVAVAIHDWEYNFSSESRDVIDERFYENCLKSADVLPWWRFIKKAQIRIDAKKLYSTLKLFGGKAFLEAQKKGKALLKNAAVAN